MKAMQIEVRFVRPKGKGVIVVETPFELWGAVSALLEHHPQANISVRLLTIIEGSVLKQDKSG